jgi:hypothetical protein
MDRRMVVCWQDATKTITWAGRKRLAKRSKNLEGAALRLPPVITMADKSRLEQEQRLLAGRQAENLVWHFVYQIVTLITALDNDISTESNYSYRN